MAWPTNGDIGQSTANGAFGGLTASGTRLQIPYAILQTGMGVGVPPSGVIGANGALTLGSSLPLTYSNGAYMYFPAASIGAATPAALFWVVMTSGTTGTIYNNVYTSGNPLFIASPVAFSGTAGSTYTQDLTEITVSSVTIPGNALGANGQIHATALFSVANTAGSKNLKEKFSGNGTYTVGATSTSSARLESNVINNGANMQKVANATTGYSAATAGGAVTRTITDTTIDQLFVHTVQLSAATDFAFLDALKVEVWPT